MACAPPSFVTQGREYSHTFTATGSPKPTCNVTAGTLPMDMSNNDCFRAWLGVLQAGKVRTMVDGFLNSTEYRLRLGQP